MDSGREVAALVEDDLPEIVNRRGRLDVGMQSRGHNPSNPGASGLPARQQSGANKHFSKIGKGEAAR